MASRSRLGVALLLDGPVAGEIDGLRRALGDRALARIASHITLVPPVNVRAGDIPAALDVVRRGAQACGAPLRLILGPPSSFLPANPVVHLPVSGDLSALGRLRDAVFAGPLARPLSWPWVPHVTLADDADPEGIEASLAALRHYEVMTVVDRVVVLEERRTADGADGRGHRRWEPFADAALAPPVLVGRGGQDLTIVGGRLLDPEAASLAEATGVELTAVRDPLVVTGIVAGELVGVAMAWRTDDGGRIAVSVAAARRRMGFGRHLLGHAEGAVRAAGWECPVLSATGPAGFYAACSRWSVVATDRPPGGRVAQA